MKAVVVESCAVVVSMALEERLSCVSLRVAHRKRERESESCLKVRASELG
jgi:hypothetical protein